MDLRYLHHCPVGTPYYDTPDTGATADQDFAAVLAPPPPGWSQGDLAEWVVLTPPDHELPSQGWKIHVSAGPDNAERVLETVRSYCFANGVMFKFIRSATLLHRRNSKYGDRGSSGKFMALYPLNDDHLAVILAELGELLDGESGPYILSDLRWRSGPLYVRYGGFVARMGRAPSGELVHCVEDPDGRLVPDVRGPSFRPPSWVTLPDCLQQAVAARNTGTLRDFPYRATKALHFSNGGGVYRATHLHDGSEVLLKEARPLAGLDEDGTDAVTRLAREHWALTTLAGLPAIPRALDFRKGSEHWFLAREYVEGASLAKETALRNPVVNGSETVTAQDTAAYTRWALDVLDQVDETVRAMHERGVVFGDLHPNNILVRPDGTVAFIDLETASEAADDTAQAIGAPGFRAPAGWSGTAVDRYALGCVRLSVFLPLTVVVPWAPEKTDQLLQLITDRFPVPPGFADQVRRELGHTPAPPAAGRRPTDVVWTTPDAANWPETRDRIAAAVLASATPHRTDRLFPGDVEQFTTPGGGLGFANGAAGVLWALARTGATVPEEHIQWLSAAVRTAADPRPGFHHGLAGIAYALDRLGRPAEALDVLDRALALPREDLDDSLHSGLSGLGLTLLHFADRTGDSALLDAAAAIAAQVTRQSRPTTSAPDRQLPGLLHGGSGEALFLLRMYERTLDHTHLDAAESALRRDLAETGRLPYEQAPEGAPWGRPHLGAGSAGPGMVLHDFLAHRPTPELVAVRDTILSGLRPEFAHQSGLFNGRAGTLAALTRLDDGSRDTARAIRAHLAGFGWHAIPYQGHLTFLGDQTLRLSADLGTGASGVLLTVNATLTGRPCLPFFSAPRPASLGPEREPVRILAGTAS
ncbi:class III lanthionine synthetase LanKC [Streptomyces flavidovirens]|uniref:non-specific serine/threonine protein kinase n=1 Tax=Streptomyces flavidovirens TaxID=67298 RepID=A0ABW6RDV6_9ACTN